MELRRSDNLPESPIAQNLETLREIFLAFYSSRTFLIWVGLVLGCWIEWVKSLDDEAYPH